MHDDTAVATKGDLTILEADIKRHFDMSVETMRLEMRQNTDDTKRHFDLTVETIRHDLKGANKDQIEVLKDAKVNHERRIRVLERRAGVVAA